MERGRYDGIPFDDDRFDLIVCQFGLMIVPEKLKALREMRRVLRRGGKLTFNVWGSIEDSAVWKIAVDVLNSFLEINPILQDPGPFTMTREKNSIPLLEKAGFENIKAVAVIKERVIEAAVAAHEFIQGLPVFTAKTQKNLGMLPQIISTLDLKLNNQLGDRPLRSP